MKAFITGAAGLFRFAPIALVVGCASYGGTPSPESTAAAEPATPAQAESANVSAPATAPNPAPAPAAEVAAAPVPETPAAPVAAAEAMAEPAPTEASAEPVVPNALAEAVVAAVGSAPAAPAEPAEPVEPAAQTAPPAAPAKASLAAFEIKRPVLAAGVRVRLREGASVLNRPLAGASSAGAPAGALTLGSSVDNADGTFWYVREGERALGWVSQGDLAAAP